MDHGQTTLDLCFDLFSHFDRLSMTLPLFGKTCFADVLGFLYVDVSRSLSPQLLSLIFTEEYVLLFVSLFPS